jgi:hypothetical protein
MEPNFSIGEFAKELELLKEVMAAFQNVDFGQVQADAASLSADFQALAKDAQKAMQDATKLLSDFKSKMPAAK